VALCGWWEDEEVSGSSWLLLGWSQAWPPSSREGASASHVQMEDKSHIPAATFAIVASNHMAMMGFSEEAS